MTFELTPERLQEIAVGCVSQFIQKTASLNEAISKEAQALELNPDQTKRVIEASNTIAYLRQLEKSADRTFEFEVADYGKVMAHMCMPEDMLKSAGTPPWLDKDKDGKEDDKEDDKGEKKDESGDKDDAKEKKFPGENFGKDKKEEKSESKDEEKSDEKEDKSESKDEDKSEKKDEKEDKSEGSDESDEEEKSEDSDEEKQEKRAMLMKAYFQGKATLEKMAYDEASIYMELTKAAGAVAKDPVGLEKLAFVVEASDLDKLTKLCGIEKRAQDDLVFTDKELSAAKELQGIYKKAQTFVKEKAELTDFVKRAEALLFKQPVDLEKQAFIGGLIARAAGGITHGLAASAAYVARKATTGLIVNPAKNSMAFSQSAKAKGLSTKDAIGTYDKIRSTGGHAAAMEHFGGNRPGMLQRAGIGGVLTATTGLSMDHENNVKDLNN